MRICLDERDFYGGQQTIVFCVCPRPVTDLANRLGSFQAVMDLETITGDDMEIFFKDRLQALQLSDAISIGTVNNSVGKGIPGLYRFGVYLY